MADPTASIPNIPGLKPNRVDRSQKNNANGFRFHHGVAFPKEKRIDPEVLETFVKIKYVTGIILDMIFPRLKRL